MFIMRREHHKDALTPPKEAAIAPYKAEIEANIAKLNDGLVPEARDAKKKGKGTDKNAGAKKKVAICLGRQAVAGTVEPCEPRGARVTNR